MAQVSGKLRTEERQEPLEKESERILLPKVKLLPQIPQQ